MTEPPGIALRWKFSCIPLHISYRHNELFIAPEIKRMEATNYAERAGGSRTCPVELARRNVARPVWKTRHTLLGGRFWGKLLRLCSCCWTNAIPGKHTNNLPIRMRASIWVRNAGMRHVTPAERFAAPKVVTLMQLQPLDHCQGRGRPGGVRAGGGRA